MQLDLHVKLKEREIKNIVVNTLELNVVIGNRRDLRNLGKLYAFKKNLYKTYPSSILSV